MKLYLAGPISGGSYPEVVEKIEAKRQVLSMFECLSPMTGKEYLRTETVFKSHGYEGVPTSSRSLRGSVD